MIRLLIIECVLSALLGAIVYRLAYAFLGQRRKAWVVALITAAALGAGVSGVIDPYLLREFTDVTGKSYVLPEWLIQTLRAFTYLLGAALAHRVVKKREALGFDHQPPYDS